MLPPTQVEVVGIATVQTPEPRLEMLLAWVPPNRPLKVVLVLSAPMPGLRAAPVTMTVPAPAREPTESLPVSSQNAPARMMTGVLSAMRLALPLVSALPLMTRPASITRGPWKVEVALSCRLPLPVLVRPPAPPTTPASVSTRPEVGMSMVAIPPERLKLWLLAVVAEPPAIVAVTPV